MRSMFCCMPLAWFDGTAELCDIMIHDQRNQILFCTQRFRRLFEYRLISAVGMFTLRFMIMAIRG